MFDSGILQQQHDHAMGSDSRAAREGSSLSTNPSNSSRQTNDGTDTEMVMAHEFTKLLGHSRAIKPSPLAHNRTRP